MYGSFSLPSDRNKKGMFYIAQNPVRWTAQSVLHFSSPGRPVHSETNSASPGSILAVQQLRKDDSLTFPPLSIARYACIHLPWLRRRGDNENAHAPNLRNGIKGDSNPGSLDCESGILPLSYCAPHIVNPASSQ